MIIGLTGGIASGKSTVAKTLGTLGAYNIPHFIAQSIEGGVDYGVDSFEPIANWGADPAAQDDNGREPADVATNPHCAKLLNLHHEHLILDPMHTGINLTSTVIFFFNEGFPNWLSNNII